MKKSSVHSLFTPLLMGDTIILQNARRATRSARLGLSPIGTLSQMAPALFECSATPVSTDLVKRLSRSINPTDPFDLFRTSSAACCPQVGETLASTRRTVEAGGIAWAMDERLREVTFAARISASFRTTKRWQLLGELATKSARVQRGAGVPNRVRLLSRIPQGHRPR